MGSTPEPPMSLGEQKKEEEEEEKTRIQAMKIKKGQKRTQHQLIVCVSTT